VALITFASLRSQLGQQRVEGSSVNQSAWRKMVVVLAAPAIFLPSLMAASPGSAAEPRAVSSSAIQHSSAAHLTTTAGEWAPTSVPPPSVLPSGLPVLDEQLNATSCSSSSFCVTVGYVSDTSYNDFPLVDTYAGGTWTSALVSTPINIEPGFWTGMLNGVSCPVDGECIAVGLYYSYDQAADSAYQDPLLANLANGSWTSIQGGMPFGIPHGEFNVSSVSCPTTTFCSAAGTYSYNSNLGMIWDWSPTGWSTSVIPIPAQFANSLSVLSISCADPNDCVAVGSYADGSYSPQGMILTYSTGVWTSIEAPLPANSGAGTGTGTALTAIDCPQSDYCLAVGRYRDQSQIVQPLLDVFSSGVWSPVEGPVPADAVGYQGALLSGVYCPTEGSCVATGAFGGVNGFSGMILTQSDNTWSAADAPLPPGLLSAVRRGGMTQLATMTSSSLMGVGCDASGFCASGGTDGTTGLQESGQLTGIPTIASIAPNVGAVGSMVAVNGSNFSSTSQVQFGGIAASTTFVSPTELQAVVPSTAPCGSSITVSTDGFATRTELDGLFVRSGCSAPGAPLKVKSVPGNARATVWFKAPTIGGGEAPSAYLVTATDLTSSSRGGQVVEGASSPIVVKGLMPGDQYSFNVTATNSVGSGPASLPSAPVALVLSPLAVVASALSPATRGLKYATVFKATGGYGALAWTVTAGTLPNGLQLSTSGHISGKVPHGQPTGNYSFTVTVTDLHLPVADSASATLVLAVT
jgi:hypothetical protein